VTLNRTALLAFAVASTLSASRAAADACVQIDADRDTLSDQERNASRSLLIQALEQNGEKVSRKNGCTATYTAYAVKLGNSITATVVGPQGTRTMTVRAVEDLPNVYDQIVRSLQSGQPLSTSGTAMSRDNVTANQAAPRRAEADSLYYVKLGYGSTIGGGAASGPAFGGGYRYELDQLGIDISFFNMQVSTTETVDSYGSSISEVSLTGSWAKLMGLWFMDPKANSSLYFGSGIQGELSAGYELLRASSIRIFAQADLTLPFYKTTLDYTTSTSAADSRYTPTVMVTLGMGYRPRSVLSVNVIP
jgi:hypothetical protein